jgi:hypothetical protein
MSKRLSGWARLWIAVALVIWGVGAWQTLTTIGGPPNPNPNDATVCARAWLASGRDPAFLEDCPRDPLAVGAARRNYESYVSEYPSRLVPFALPWLLAPFLIAVAWGVGRWIQRGFGAQSN